jgi:hypothetical protein
MRRGEPEPPEPRHAVHPGEELGEIDVAIPIGIHGLPQEHHLGEASTHERVDLPHDLRDRPIDLGPPGPRHDAEAANVVAALHRRDEGPHRIPVGYDGRRNGERVLGAVEIHDDARCRLLEEGGNAR